MFRSAMPNVHVPTGDGRSGGGGGSFRRILVEADSFGLSAPALAAAARLSDAVSGQVRVVHVRTWDPGPKGAGRFFFESSSAATTVLDQAVTSVWQAGTRASGVVIEARRTRMTAVIAAQAAWWRADLVVVARRPRRPLGVLLLGSRPDQLMRAVRCPVLVVREEGR